MDDYLRELIKKIEKRNKDCSFEVLYLNDSLVIFANRGSYIEDIKDEVSEKLEKKFSHTLRSVNGATGYVVPLY